MGRAYLGSEGSEVEMMMIPHRGKKGDEYAQMVECLKEWKFPIGRARALDMFARRGEFRSVDYVAEVGQLEAWEISRPALEAFQIRYPWARVLRCNSIDKIVEAREEGIVWDMIVADHPVKAFGKEYFEHFEFLDDAFHCLSPTNESVIVFNVMQEARSPDDVSEARRSEWYGTEDKWLSLGFLTSFYIDFFASRGGAIKNLVFISQLGRIEGYWIAVYHFEGRSEVCHDRYLLSGTTAQDLPA